MIEGIYFGRPRHLCCASPVMPLLLDGAECSRFFEKIRALATELGFSLSCVRDANYILVLSRRFLASAQFSAEMLCVAPRFTLWLGYPGMVSLSQPSNDSEPLSNSLRVRFARCIGLSVSGSKMCKTPFLSRSFLAISTLWVRGESLSLQPVDIRHWPEGGNCEPHTLFLMQTCIYTKI